VPWFVVAVAHDARPVAAGTASWGSATISTRSQPISRVSEGPSSTNRAIVRGMTLSTLRRALETGRSAPHKTYPTQSGAVKPLLAIRQTPVAPVTIP
jgi:hypothetical protein